MALLWVPVYHPIQSISQHLSKACQGELGVGINMSQCVTQALEDSCKLFLMHYSAVPTLIALEQKLPLWQNYSHWQRTKTPLRVPSEVSETGRWEGNNCDATSCTGIRRKPLDLPMATDANMYASAINIHYDSIRSIRINQGLNCKHSQRESLT